VIDTLGELAAFLQAEASRRGVRLASNTHYDAGDWELQWWRGRTLHRVNFQPLDAEIVITHYRDLFRAFPRFLRWAHNAIPMFPYLARIEWNQIDTIRLPTLEESLSRIISERVRGGGLSQAVLHACTKASNRPANSPVAQKFSGCHSTPTQKRRSARSIASTTPSGAVAETVKPGATVSTA
jgi:hypothetical protein